MAYKLSDAGDTIVEVLLAIAIISFVLVAAYATANKNTLINQDTQERSQALQLASAQIEFLHNTAVSLGSNDCYSTAGVPQLASAGGSPCNVTADGTPANGAQPAYDIAITKPGATTYQVQVTWDSLVRAGKSNVTLYYQQP